MAEIPNNPNGIAADEASQPAQVGVLAQYIKDLSFENPNAPQALQQQGDDPNLKVNVNVNARPIEGDIYESQIHLTVEAKNEHGPLYQVELVYAGVFKMTGVPEEALKPVLLINCASLLFPFARRIVADLTQEGGYPKLLLDPIDFAGIYQQNVESGAIPQAAGANADADADT